jgi:hypothetical protein
MFLQIIFSIRKKFSERVENAKVIEIYGFSKSKHFRKEFIGLT